MRGRQSRAALGLAVALLIIAAIFVGCLAGTGSRSAGSAAPNDDQVDTPVDWKPESSLAGGLQRFSSFQELRDFLKTAPAGSGYWYLNDTHFGGSLSAEDAQASAWGGSADYSKTNIQVEGVDEADIVKNDGQYIYLATDNRLVIARAYPSEKAGIVYKTELDGNIEGLFINGDRLVVLQGGGVSSTFGFGGSLANGYSDNTTVRVYDVSDRDNPVLERELCVDGYYVSSRMIGDYVYLIASGSAWAGEDDVSFPKISDGNGTVEIQPAEIWHSATPDNGYGFTTIMSINVANDDEEPVHETLLMGSASTIYVSPNNIYITFPDWSGGSETTSIHRIHIEEGRIEYQATGEVPGTLLNQFSMDEHGEYLRVATTTWNWNASTTEGNRNNNLYVLDKNLDIFGRLENLAPGEQIYSARFMGSRCYLVTFKTVDPLFVIDLADPGMPAVLGELKIPGYSEYLHPYDENHVIGVGKDVDETIDAEKVHEEGAVYYTAIKGVKISLFDVTDVSNPKEIARYVIGDRGTESPVAYDQKAFLFDRAKNLLVLPVSVVESNPLAPTDLGYASSWQGVYVFDISLERGLELKGKITHCDSDQSENRGYDWYHGYSSCSIERSLYIGNVLYTISGQKIGMNDLDTLKEIGKISLN